MNKSEIKKKIKFAIQLKNKGCYKDSNDVLHNIINNYPNFKLTADMMLLIAGNYFELKDHKNAINHSHEVIAKSPDNELANMILYLSYYNIDDHGKAFKILFAYLEKFKAELFKDTLEELLDGLLYGYGTNHKSDIIYYSRKNNVEIPKKLKI